MPRRPRWERFLSEISEWDQRFERDRLHGSSSLPALRR
jgi:hypothetical protein